VLKVLRLMQTTGGVEVVWVGGTNATQYVERAAGLTGSNPPWIVIFTNIPGMPETNRLFDGKGPIPRFYRIKAERAR